MNGAYRDGTIYLDVNAGKNNVDIGETAILLSLPAGHEALAASILRFICFDGGGLALMVAAFTWLIMSQPKKTTEPL